MALNLLWLFKKKCMETIFFFEISGEKRSAVEHKKKFPLESAVNASF